MKKVMQFVLSGCLALALAGCSKQQGGSSSPSASSGSSGSSGSSAKQEKVITFWHLDTTDAQQAAWRTIADRFEAKHPGVKIEITVLANDSFKQKLSTVMQSGWAPDVFRSWGGGGMYDQEDAGMLRDISGLIKNDPNVAKIGKGAMGVYADGAKQFGIPYDMGVVGFWYNPVILKECGLTPDDFATWTKFLDSCKKIKAKGYAPVALGEQETWTGHYWWTYIAQRLGSQEDFLDAYNGTNGGAFNKGSFLKAMEMLQEFVATKPFQEGYMATSQAEQEALVADRKAAITLMGQWAPSTGRDNSTTGGGDPFGFMPFPTIEGGKDELVNAQGGGNGYCIGKDAPDEAVEFVLSFFEPENYRIIVKDLNAIPLLEGYDDLIDDNAKKVVKAVAEAKYYQLYYDQFLPSAVAEDIKDATAAIIANNGSMTPQQACDKIQKSWEANK